MCGFLLRQWWGPSHTGSAELGKRSLRLPPGFLCDLRELLDSWQFDLGDEGLFPFSVLSCYVNWLEREGKKSFYSTQGLPLKNSAVLQEQRLSAKSTCPCFPVASQARGDPGKISFFRPCTCVGSLPVKGLSDCCHPQRTPSLCYRQKWRETARLGTKNCNQNPDPTPR